MKNKKVVPTKPRVFEPRQGCLLVKHRDVEETTAGGLYVPDNAKEKPQEGIVLESHPGNQYQAGDTLLFRKYAGTDVKLDGTMLLILPEEDVLGRMV